MNRFATVLYPSLPTTSDGTPNERTPQESTRAASPAPLDTSGAQFISAYVRSIYEDPRNSRFSSPPPLAVDHRTVSDSQVINDDHRPNVFVRRMTDEPYLNMISSAGPSSRSGSSTPVPRLRRADRTLRVNLMQVATTPTPKSKSKRQQAVIAPTGRLTAMAKGTQGRYVIGGGQYLRVMEVGEVPHTDASDSGILSPPRMAASRSGSQPFAKGPGGATITEISNLWKGAWAIGKGVNDVDWGIGAFDSKIVTANPSGNFMIFDVNRGKLDREVTGGHPRPMNCITAAKTAPYGHLLLTGGTEGQAKIWDLRDQEPVSRKNFKHNSSVTALCFCVDDPHQFVVGTDTGGLFRYDYRVPNKAVGKVWGAHGSKPVFDLKWKTSGDEYAPMGQGWLASAGGDRTVQIWDMSQAWNKAATPVHTLHPAYQIRCVDWRPSHPTEIAVVPFNQALASSTSDGNLAAPDNAPTATAMMAEDIETSLEVWDVRRHYVAKYALPGCDSPGVSAIWDDADSIVACYQNGGFVQVDLESRIAPKTYPLESIPRQAIAWSVKHELAFAIDRFKQGEIPFDDIKTEYAAHWQVARPRKGIADSAYEPMQATGVFPLSEERGAEFEYLAFHYKLEGDPPEKLCQWNREVAELCGHDDQARMWDFLQGLLEEFGTAPQASVSFNEGVFTDDGTTKVISNDTSTPSVAPDRPTGVAQSVYEEHSGIKLEETYDIVAEGEEEEVSDAESLHSMSDSDEMSLHPSPARRSRFKAFIPPPTPAMTTPRSRMAILRSDSSATSVPNASNGGYTGVLVARTKKLQIETPSDYDTPTLDMDYPDPYGIAAALESSIARGGTAALTSRSTPQSTRPPTPAPPTLNDRGTVSGSRLANASKSGSDTPPRQPKDRVPAITRQAANAFSTEEWDAYRGHRSRALLDWWKSYIVDGDVQLATYISIIGAPVINFPSIQTERVLGSYLELLERYRLEVPAAYVRRFCGIFAAETLPSHEGVTHILHCSNCGKSTGSLEDTPETKRFWWCTRCLRGAKICVICHEPVRGLIMRCNKCHHGGHQQCMRGYYWATESPTSNRASAHVRGHSLSLGPHPGVRGALESGFSDRVKGHTSCFFGDDAEGGHSGVLINTCPTGCGCYCRTVLD